MDKYLLQILHDVNTIIIPGLGALTVTNSKTGEIMFMSFLKHDDGNLSAYISEKEGISENDAKNIIAKYVREINAKLDKGESYDMYQFGRFLKVAGEIEFENWSKFNTGTAESDSKENALVVTPIEEKTPVEKLEEKAEIVEEKVAEKIIEPKKVEEKDTPIEKVVEKAPIIAEKIIPTEEKPIAKSIDEVLQKNEEKIADKPKLEEPKIIEKLEPVIEQEKITEKIIPPVVEVEKKVTKEPESKIKANVKATKEVEKPFLNKVKKEKKKRGAGFYVLIGLIVLLALGGAGAAIFYDKIEKIFFASTEKVDELIDENQAEEENLDEIENQVEIGNKEDKIEDENTAVVSKEVKSEPIKEKVIQQVSSSGLSYHIIGGGFSSESNATRLAQKFSAEGKNACVLGKFDDLYLVAYQSFSSQEEAKSALAKADVKGWIFKYDKK